eukprot:CAMPEP_0175414046 /NCGR_PEP_ID=MMETSP0095-20121207/43464_1 /TAXON_ID=311494 /ORGANISM="Alexandrium monilatum, Strain CCMP3105" /LENGTH=211 /DNA_ID=CAMNT_0016713099 /DNA_START=54 /DNA_END=685 /DNA_ORIENTATION=-
MSAAWWEREAALPPQKRADGLRRRGDELYSQARATTKDQNSMRSLAAVQESLRTYQAAIECFCKAVELAPTDFRLFANRALCYAAVEDWQRCREDALRCIELEPSCPKGWLILTKALCQLGSAAAARSELERGLAALPACGELLELQAALAEWEPGGGVGRSLGHSISPARGSPGASRAADAAAEAAAVCRAGAAEYRRHAADLVQAPQPC